MEIKKPRVYLTSPVFREIASNPKVSAELREKIQALYHELEIISQLVENKTRFPSEAEIYEIVKYMEIDFIGCHLSHQISQRTAKSPSLKAVCTSTAGFNHIFQDPHILITHTPSILDKTVADFTIGLIISSLRNLVGMHNFLWQGGWAPGQKWDLDENLNNTLDNMILGIVGLGEIGREVTRRIAPWGVKKIIYHNPRRNKQLEARFENLEFRDSLVAIFREADIISVHIPLNKDTKHIINGPILKQMKPNALLVNTARGPIIDFKALTRLLRAKEIQIDLAFDVYEDEPIPDDTLNDFKQILREQPERRFLFTPHIASSDADTRAQMSSMLLEDLITLVKSDKLEDLQPLRLIPGLKYLTNAVEAHENPSIDSFRIMQYWHHD
jgi:glyoxylate reductase